MTNPKTPAFPTLNFDGEKSIGTIEGLTKREYFAIYLMAAMVGEIWLLITQGGMTGYESICLNGKYPAQLKLAQGNTPWIACAGCQDYSRERSQRR